MSNQKLLWSGFGMGSPAVQAWLYLAGGTEGINIFPYITSISLQKDMTQPAGMFDIKLAYAPDEVVDPFLHPPGQNPIYAIKKLLDDHSGVKPFDYLELRIQDQSGSTQPTYYFNGFIDNITFTENAGSGNQMQRTVGITGRDYGSLLQNFQINYMNPTLLTKGLEGEGLYLALANSIVANSNVNAQLDYSTLEKTLKNFNITEHGSNSTADFVNFIVQQGININHIKSIQATYNSNIRPIFHRKQVPSSLGTFTASADLMGYQGSLDELIRQVQSPPWAEYFIRDENPGPVLYYRIAPYLDANGYYAWVNPDARVDFGYHNEIQYVDIPSDDVMSTSLSKSQNEVYTAFLTTASNMFLSDATSFISYGLTKWKGQGNPYNDGFSPQSDVRARMDKFGYRLYQANTPWVIGIQDPKTNSYSSPGQGSDFSNGFPPIALDGFNQIQRLNMWLVATMGRMEELYSGTITCRGIHGVRVGDYIYYQRRPSELGRYFYVQGVAIDWTEGSPITETLSVIRGQYLSHMDPFQRVLSPRRDSLSRRG